MIIMAVAVTLVMISCIVIFSFLSPTTGEDRGHKVSKLWAKMLLLLFNTKIEIIGAENISLGKPLIMMANHQSDFDILVLLAGIPGQFRWIAKKELFRIPLFGTAMRKCGYIDIDRQNHEKAMESIEKALQKVREGKSIMSFPEGTRSRNGIIRPFKRGMFRLAVASGAPIVPLSIIGSGQIMPKGSLNVKPGKITVVIGKPIDVSNYTAENHDVLIEQVRSVIIRNYEEHGIPPINHDSPDSLLEWQANGNPIPKNGTPRKS
jgi:1-acyl-sn-glycerol-3-phosphate acyltransferase